MVYLLAVHLPIIGLTLIPVLFKWLLLLLPTHIVFLELIIDPTCSMVFEAAGEELDIMKKPPRSSREKLLDQRTVILGLSQGAVVLVFSLVMLLMMRSWGWSEHNMRAVIFAILVLSNLALIFVNISQRFSVINPTILHNRALWLVVITTLGGLTAVLFLPFLKNLFYF